MMDVTQKMMVVLMFLALNACGSSQEIQVDLEGQDWADAVGTYLVEPIDYSDDAGNY